jgi:WD40 repeat protein
MERFLVFIIITFVVTTSTIFCAPREVLSEEPKLVIDSGGHMGMIWDLLFTQDGKYLVSVSWDKTIRVWDMATGETVRVLRGQIGEGLDGIVHTVALSPDDRLLAVGGRFTGRKEEHGAIRLIDFLTGQILTLLTGHEGMIDDLAFSQDGNRLISGGGDHTARIWDVQSRKTLHILKGHTEKIFTVAFSPDGELAVTGSEDNTLKFWDAKSGTLITTLEEHTGDVESAVFTPDGKYLLSGSLDKTIRMWDTRSCKFIKVLTKLQSGVLSLSISPDGTEVIAGCVDSATVVVSIPSGE